MSMPVSRSFVFAVGLAVFALSACSLVLDPDEKQCKKTSECTAPYVCGAKGYCEEQSGCESDTDCRQPGICRAGRCEAADCSVSDECEGAELCDRDGMRCVAETEAVCMRASDCAKYEGAEVCIKSEQRCGEIECGSKDECGTSPSAVCTKGSCEDPIWGCLGQPDARLTDGMSSEGSLEVKVNYVIPSTGELETAVRNLTVRVCAAGDVVCATSVSDDYSYDGTVLTVRGLENGKVYAIRLFATHPTIASQLLLETEYQMYRPIMGKTVDPRPIVMFEAAFRDSISQAAGVKFEADFGLVLAYVLDCRDIEVAGVSVGVDRLTAGCNGDPTCVTTPFYFTTSNFPDPTATQTGSAGRLGIVNMVPEEANLLTLTRTADNKPLLTFAVTPRKDVVTYSFFYPQRFSRAD